MINKFIFIFLFLFLSFGLVCATDYTLVSDEDICLKSNTSEGWNFYQLRLQEDGFHDFSDNPLSCGAYFYDSSHLIVLTYNFKNGSVFHEYLYNDDCTYYFFEPFNSSFFSIASFGHLIQFQAGSDFNLSTIISSISLELRYKLSGYWDDISELKNPASFPDNLLVYRISNITQNTNCPDPIPVSASVSADLPVLTLQTMISGYSGVSLSPNLDIVLSNITFNLSGIDPMFDVSLVGIYNYSDGSLIKQASIDSSGVAYFTDVVLYSGQSYFIASNRNGSSYVMNYETSITYPISNEFFNITSGLFDSIKNTTSPYFFPLSSSNISSIISIGFYENATTYEYLNPETIYLSPNSEFLFRWSDYEIPGYNFDNYSYNWAYLKKISPSGGECWPNYEVLIQYPDNETFTDENTYAYNPSVTCYFGYDRSISEDVIKITTGDYDTTFSLRVFYCSAIGTSYSCDDKVITFVVTGGIQESGVSTLADFFPKFEDTSIYKWLGFIIIGCFVFFGIMLVCVPLRWSSFSLVILFLLFLVGAFFTALNGYVSWAWVITPLALAVVYFTFKLLGGFN